MRRRWVCGQGVAALLFALAGLLVVIGFDCVCGLTVVNVGLCPFTVACSGPEGLFEGYAAPTLLGTTWPASSRPPLLVPSLHDDANCWPTWVRVPLNRDC